MDEIQYKKYFRLLFITCVFSAAIDGFFSFAYTGLSNIIPRYFGISDTELFFFSMMAGIGGILSIISGALADKIGRKKTMLLVNFLFLFVIILISISNIINTPLFFLIWFFIWNFITLSDIWAIPLIDESPPEKRGKIQGIAVMVSGLSLLPIAIFVIFATIDNWQIIYYFGLIIVIPGIYLNFKMDESKSFFYSDAKDKELSIKSNYKELFNKENRTTLIIVVFMVLSSALSTSTGQYDVIFMTNVKLFPQSLVSIVFLLSFPLPITIYLGLIVSEKIGRKKAIIIFTSLALLFKLIYTFSFNIPIVIISYLLKLFMNFCTKGVIGLFISELFPTRIRGTSAGFSKSVSKLSFFITPLFGMLIFMIIGNIDYNSLWPFFELLGADPSTIVPGVSDYGLQAFSYVFLFVTVSLFDIIIILVILVGKPTETAGIDLRKLHSANEMTENET